MDRAIAQCALLFFTVLAAAPTIAQRPSSGSEATEAVWIWSKRCNADHKLGITIRVDHRVAYRGVLSICHGSRDQEDGRTRFHFPGGHSFQAEYRTRSTDSIEGDVWQAGGEPNYLILGIMFTGQMELLNTLHIAKPNERMSSELDKGLFVTTYPAPAPK